MITAFPSEGLARLVDYDAISAAAKLGKCSETAATSVGTHGAGSTAHKGNVLPALRDESGQAGCGEFTGGLSIVGL